MRQFSGYISSLNNLWWWRIPRSQHTGVITDR
jgi:hypothetical protein